MYTNPNGISSKIQSLQIATEALKPHIITLAETKLQSIPPLLQNYKWITRNRPTEGGGVAILIRNDITQNTKTINNLEDQNQEILWAETNLNKNPIAVGIYYGPQESTSNEEIERHYSQLKTQITNLQTKNKSIILTGDFNAKLEIDSPNISQTLSRNGKHLANLIQQTNLIPITTHNKYINWTRENRHNQNEKSIIDYILISPELKPDIKNLNIDNTTHILKGKSTTDHNTITMKLNIKHKPKNQTIHKWNLNNKQGWIDFNTQIQTNLNKHKNPSYQQFQNSLHETLNNTIGKIYINPTKTYYPTDQKTKLLRRTVKDLRKNLKISTKTNHHSKQQHLNQYLQAQKQLKNHLENIQKLNIENKVKTIIKQGGPKSHDFWKIRRRIMKNNSTNTYDTITEDNTTIENPQQAKEYIANYFEDLYQAREGTPSHEHWTQHITNTVETLTKLYKNQYSEHNKITMKDLKSAIKKLKPKKANGPDNIPNEVLINSSQQTKNTILYQYNKILQTETIPPQWQHSTITTIYKGKGTKGKCSNERGITLSSNIGKTFERIINNRLIQELNISEAQAGGIKNRATSDHIMLLNEILKTIKPNTPKYLTFLDVTKAFDKAWSDAILYTMNKNGSKDLNWTITKKLNEDLTAQIRTKHGLTRKITINNSIRQGGVLSGTQYALLMDEINKDLTTKNLGIELPKSKIKIPALLWMDDVVLISDSRQEMQQMLDQTNHTAKKYHIQFGQAKSETMIIGKGKPDKNFTLGDTTLNTTTKYKYLGVTLNNKNNLTDHITNIKQKTEAAYQTILAILQDSNFKGIQLKSAWKLLETCIKPIITHSLEALEINKTSMKELNKIWEAFIKRILKTPISTPTESLYIETGLIDIETTIEQNRLRMASRLLQSKIQIMQIIKQENIKNGWWENTNKIAQKHDINLEDLQGSKQSINKLIKQKTLTSFHKRITETAKDKSKIQYMLQVNNTWEAGKQQPYLNFLTRERASIIFQTRTRMIKIKTNYKNAHNNTTCRMCKSQEETQQHILNECQALHTDNTTKIDPKDLFTQNKHSLNEIAIKIEKILTSISETQ